jgi:uncharacterized membrane protein AbrB (regulator of aidB expression)
MSLTAEALNLAVTLVTAMQIIRMVLIQAATLPLYRWTADRLHKRGYSSVQEGPSDR